MKKILKLFSMFVMVFVFLTGCGGFIEDDSLVISNITSEVLDDGRTMVVITYTDEEIAPSIFYLPKGDTGEQGPQGDGIEKIEHEQDPATGNVTITIYFTNEEMEPITYTLKNGVSITGVTTSEPDENGTVYITINYSNGESSDPIAIPKGEKGNDGTTILDYYYETDEASGITYLTFILSDGRMCTFEVPPGKDGEDGKDGRGIKSMESYIENDKYVIKIIYTDDVEQKLYLDRPNQCITEAREPTTADGKDGDFFFNSVSRDFYTKVNGSWILVIDFDAIEDTCVVTFDLNSSDAYYPAGFGYSNYYTIPSGSNFATSGEVVPIPCRDGYDFNGWYTTKTPSVVHGTFNDLTTVSSDLTLYANWVEKV